jgi:hypothetical protein
MLMGFSLYQIQFSSMKQNTKACGFMRLAFGAFKSWQQKSGQNGDD